MTGQWQRLCRVDDLIRDRPTAIVVGDTGQDRDRICVAVTRGGEPVAILDRCPHRDIALSGGTLREGTLVCPGHFWCFDLETGVRTDAPAHAATLYPTRVVDGWVEAVVPPPAKQQPMREWLLAQARSRPPR